MTAADEYLEARYEAERLASHLRGAARALDARDDCRSSSVADALRAHIRAAESLIEEGDEVFALPADASLSDVAARLRRLDGIRHARRPHYFRALSTMRHMILLQVQPTSMPRPRNRQPRISRSRRRSTRTARAGPDDGPGEGEPALAPAPLRPFIAAARPRDERPERQRVAGVPGAAGTSLANRRS